MNRSATRRAGFAVALALLGTVITPAISYASAPLEPTAHAAPGQSDQPAPASKRKQVIGAVHTDTVSAYLDEGNLVLQSRADIDTNGDGVAELGTRLTTSDVLFHLAAHSRTTVPAAAPYEFLGAPGAPIWLAPQTQDHTLLWPGFSTEDPALAANVAGNRLDVRMLSATGPGNVEIFLQDGGTVRRVFSSTTDLAAWQTGVPQHTHMNWAFTQAGTYELEFEMRGVVGGREQAATNRYTFVVGDLADHTRSSATELTVDRTIAEPGQPFTLTAKVTPNVAGAAQFRDLTSNAVLGHAHVVDGAASFTIDSLTPGHHQIQAEFIPTWADDGTTSRSAPINLTVTGTVEPEPEHEDTAPADNDQIEAMGAGVAVTVTTPGKQVTPGATLAARTTETHAGRWISVWVHTTAPDWHGWMQTDLTGAFTIDLPEDVPTGDARLVLKDTEGALIGWDRFTVSQIGTNPGDNGNVPPPTEPPPASTPQPAPPQAPPQHCEPALTLDRGHIDMFFVSAANGKAVLQLVEDVTGHRVVHEAETVLLRVNEPAYRTNIPAGTPGAPAGYVLPLTQNPTLIWPGWDTNRTATSGHTDVTINITDVTGPGRVHLYSQGSFGDIKPLLQGGGTTLPGTIREPAPAHTHAQWVFSEPGIYQLTAHATATNPQTGVTLTTATHTYVFQVGDTPLGDVYCTMTTRAVADAAEVNAAVNRAAAEAVAASQAENPASELSDRHVHDARVRAMDATAQNDDQGGNAGTEPAVTAAIIGGGALIILGLAGGTWWYLRRLREPVSPPRATSDA